MGSQDVSTVRNVIMDLGGVMLEWNPDHLLTPFEPDPVLRGQLRAGIFGPDWHLFDRGRLSEVELIERLALCTGHTRAQLAARIFASRMVLAEPARLLLAIFLIKPGTSICVGQAVVHGASKQ